MSVCRCVSRRLCVLAFSTLPVSLITVPTAHADAFTITYLAPGVQTPASITTNYETFTTPTYVGGSLTTNFAGSSVTGTYSGAYQVYAANEYGGAGVNSYTLTLSQSQNYFGLWFSALDSGNQLQFYDGSTLVETFTPSNYAALVGVCPTSAPQPNYCGNPNSAFLNQDAGEQFAYLNFYDTTGSFNSIVFTDTVSGFGFESDNQAVAIVNPNNPIGTVLNATPEPSTFVLLGSGILGMAAAARRRLTRSWTLRVVPHRRTESL